MEPCVVCAKPASSRCSRCKAASFCSVECQKRAWPTHKPVCIAPSTAASLPVFDIRDAASPDAQAFCQHVRKRGFALIKWSAGTSAAVAGAVKQARAFLLQPFPFKRAHGAGPDVGQQHGYMDLTWTETLEVKDHHDKRFHWPSEDLQRACVGVAAQMRQASLAALRLLSTHAGMDWNAVAALLDRPAEPLETASNSALRILLYSKPGDRRATGDSHVFGTGNHTDNSFVTVAPCATVRGLEILPFDDPRHWINVEEHMRAADTLCVFVGDSLNMVSAGFYPSVVHRPNEARCLSPFVALRPGASDDERRAVGRISTPYFLRGRRDAVLDTLLLPLPSHRTDPVTVAQLECNWRRCRELWPWKVLDAHAYYTLQNFSSTMD